MEILPQIMEDGNGQGMIIIHNNIVLLEQIHSRILGFSAQFYSLKDSIKKADL